MELEIEDLWEIFKNIHFQENRLISGIQIKIFFDEIWQLSGPA